MKEQLINFETAKLAKEKGFVSYSEKSYNLIDITSTVVSGTKSGTLMSVRWDNSKINFVPAPTQSLLQKWLRDEHGILLCLNPQFGGTLVNNKQIGWFCQSKSTYNLEGRTISLSKETYEDALEIGLQAALILINN